MGVMDRIWDEVFAGPRPPPLTVPSPSAPPGGACAPSAQPPPFSANTSARPIPTISPSFSPSFSQNFSPSFGASFQHSFRGSSAGVGKGAPEAAGGVGSSSQGVGSSLSLGPMNGPADGGANAPRKLRSGLSIELPGSRGALDCTDALLAASPSPSPLPSSGDRRASTDFQESRSVGGGSAAVQQGIHIGSAAARRSSLDSARSLPTGFGFIPDILSPRGQMKEPANSKSLRPSVSEPPSAKKPPAEPRGSARLDRGGSKGRAVYDWYNPL